MCNMTICIDVLFFKTVVIGINSVDTASIAISSL